MTLKWNSRAASVTVALAMAGGLGIGVMAQAGGQAGQQTQGRAGGAGRGAQPQQPARDTPAQPQTPSTGVISGAVTAEGAGTPVRRARVTLSGPELRGGRSTVTDDEGKFIFAALPAGRFTLTASKAGYVDIPYGAKKPGRPGTPIQLAAAQKMERANISLPKGGVITGIVIDDNGEPSPGTQVRVMRYVMRTGERTLQQAGQDQSDDRGIYRVYGLQPGDYLVSAVPRNINVGDIRQTIMAEVEMLLQQAQAGGLAFGGRGQGAGGAGGGGGRGGGRGAAAAAAGIDITQIAGGRGANQDLLARAQQLQQQLAQQEEAQSVAYAPVYYPGTSTPSAASAVTLAIGEERNGVDFRLALVPTAKVEGVVQSPDGTLPQGTQVTLAQLDQAGGPTVPGVSTNTTRVNQEGRFTFNNIPPGQYRVMARGAVRQTAPEGAAGAAGRGGAGRGGQGGGGRGGPGQIAQVLWGSADVSISGTDVAGVTIALQEGMTVTGRIAFDGSGFPPTDLTMVRVNLQPRGAQQGLEIGGGVPPAQVDATGRFTIKGVVPGRYTVNAGLMGGGRGGGGRGGAAAGGATGQTTQWLPKSVVVAGRDALDFGLVVEPNQHVADATITFGDRTQEVSGTIQDTLGNPTADYSIVIFASDKQYWVPQARRIQSIRPGTDGKFTFRNLPPGEYRLTAVTDVEPGEWFDPAFLEQLVNASIPVILREGEKKVQDIKVASGG
jgi:hypothetical protein